jgi:hypothetical protein
MHTPHVPHTPFNYPLKLFKDQKGENFDVMLAQAGKFEKLDSN